MTLNGKYNAILPLKSTLDRFLAIGQSDLSSVSTEEVIALTGTGLMGIKVNVTSIAQGDPR
jgi:nuclear pore complex protein Nup133